MGLRCCIGPSISKIREHGASLARDRYTYRQNCT